jgi:hypothetical protein
MFTGTGLTLQKLTSRHYCNIPHRGLNLLHLKTESLYTTSSNTSTQQENKNNGIQVTTPCLTLSMEVG